MPYSERSLPINHIQASPNPTPQDEFEFAVFIGMIDVITRMKNGAAKLTLTVEPDYVEDVFKLWAANSIVSVNIRPWDPEWDEYEDVG